ncbi:MAG: hypothetical protein ACYC8S_01150 [Minisyncoccota bacterium]
MTDLDQKQNSVLEKRKTNTLRNFLRFYFFGLGALFVAMFLVRVIGKVELELVVGLSFMGFLMMSCFVGWGYYHVKNQTLEDFVADARTTRLVGGDDQLNPF